MLGFGPLGATPLGSAFDEIALARTTDILETVVTRFVDNNQLSILPNYLHHYTSLHTAQKILENDDIRLSHAEYSNDQMEMAQARAVIDEVPKAQAPQSNFLASVQREYGSLAASLDAYVFCMSNGDQDLPSPQDRLSQWRAYGQDGRGVCLSLDASSLAKIVRHTPGLRINPVIYDPTTQLNFVNAIITEGVNLSQAQDPSALSATVGALVFAMPLMKAQGFSEEWEWRLIFMPPAVGPSPKLEFHPRRDFLAPFLRLKYIWNDLRPQLAQIPALRPRPPIGLPTGAPLLQITGVMVGPSVHQSLNLRAMTKLLAQSPRPLAPTASDIPYRSIG